MSNIIIDNATERIIYVRAAKNERLKELNAEFEELQERIASIAEPFDDEISRYEAMINDEVMKTASSYKNEHCKATFTKGHTRVSWDTDKLLGYAVAHPAVLEFKKESEIKPRVSIKIE